MPIVLEYTTGRSVGRFRVAANSLEGALTKAGSALRGLHCTGAALLFCHDDALLSNGSVIATYTLAKGWRIIGM
jgi:hypothetical protein